MAYVKKTWKPRISQYPGRRRMVGTGEANTYDITRAEGTVTQTGDAFSADNMNDLETRIGNEFTAINNNLQTKMPKTGGAFTGPITVRGNVTALEGRFIDKNGYVVSSGGGSNTVALIWSSAMRFDVYVDGTFVGTLTPIK